MVSRPARVLCDANVYISYLLPSRTGQAIVAIVEAAFRGDFVLLIPPEVVAELADAVRRKPYLVRRIYTPDVETFVAAIRGVGEVIPPIREPLPVVTRDRKDDYLLAYALVGAADFLVTGDRDLLILGSVGNVLIVSPTEFAQRLAQG